MTLQREKGQEKIKELSQEMEWRDWIIEQQRTNIDDLESMIGSDGEVMRKELEKRDDSLAKLTQK